MEIRSSSLIREEENTIQDTQYGKLPSHRGNKKPKLGSFTLSKSFVVELNPSVPPAASIQPSMAPKANTPLPNASPSLNPITATLPESRPLTLLRSEGLAWERFQQAVTDKDIIICYDISVKEFERSTIHDLFKVFSFVHSHL